LTDHVSAQTSDRLPQLLSEALSQNIPVTLSNSRQKQDLEPRKAARIGRVRWVTEVNQALGEGLATSRWLSQVKDDQIRAGRQICQDLWPFIRELPDYMSAVKDKLPESLEPAKHFLDNLSDEERHFQDLYLKQCELAGLSRHDLMTTNTETSAATAALLAAMNRACFEGDVVSGAQAIVVAELAATQFARSATATFEQYFSQHLDQYGSEHIEEGLKWLRLHAKPNTRHALWMNRMLVGLNQEDDSTVLPETVSEILQAIFGLWCVEETIVKGWLGQTHTKERVRCQAINNQGSSGENR